MQKYLIDYLSNIAMENNYVSRDIRCEICNDSEYTVIRDIISIGKGKYGRLPVVTCNKCGFLYQNPRFNKEFYKDYYSQHYRNVIFDSPTPSQDLIDDQIKRGEFLYNFIRSYLPDSGNLLDVGSSVGAMMKPFIEHGWNALGTDPDVGYVQHGKNKLDLPVIAVDAEEMHLEDNKYDLIMIMGSLEHVYDPNVTLEICRKAAKPGSLLLLEGRGHPQSASKDYFNHHHHRYLSLNSIELIMIKYGWKPLILTDDPICGPTRPGGIFCLGRLGDKPSNEEFMEIITNGKSESVESVLKKFDVLDNLHAD